MLKRAEESKITISDLKSLIDEQVKMGENNSDNKTVDIVNVFGGINNLLQTIIDLNDKSILSQDRINIIHQIITAPKQSQQTHDTIAAKTQIKTDKNDQNEDGAQIQLKLDATNTYLTSFVGESSSFKINSPIHHKVSVLSVVVSFIVYLILTRVCDPFVWIMYGNIFCFFLWHCTGTIHLKYLSFRQSTHYIYNTCTDDTPFCTTSYIGAKKVIIFLQKDRHFVHIYRLA